MNRPSEKRGAARWFGAALLASLSVPFLCGSIREDEFLCNEAVEHFHDCCADDSPLPSDFCAVRSSCDSSHSAGLTVAQSRCIIGQSCSSLQKMCAQLRSTGAGGPGSCL
jgi:hypothetical protein